MALVDVLHLTRCPSLMLSLLVSSTTGNPNSRSLPGSLQEKRDASTMPAHQEACAEMVQANILNMLLAFNLSICNAVGMHAVGDAALPLAKRALVPSACFVLSIYCHPWKCYRDLPSLCSSP
jgi:hypothetical protein